MPVKKFPCTIDGIDYESESAAAKALGIEIMFLRHRLRSSNFPEYTSRHHPKKHRRKKFIPCSVAGIEYGSIGLAASELGLSSALLRNRLASFDYPDYVCADLPKVEKPIKYSYTVDGKKYRTLQEIADLEGVTREWIRQKMNNPKYSGYRRL